MPDASNDKPLYPIEELPTDILKEIFYVLATHMNASAVSPHLRTIFRQKSSQKMKFKMLFPHAFYSFDETLIPDDGWGHVISVVGQKCIESFKDTLQQDIARAMFRNDMDRFKTLAEIVAYNERAVIKDPTKQRFYFTTPSQSAFIPITPNKIEGVCIPSISLLELALRLPWGKEFIPIIMESVEKNINTCDDEGCTPLLNACKEGWVQSAQRLIAHGAKYPCNPKNGHHPFLYACGCGDLEMLTFLWEAFPDSPFLNEGSFRSGTPLSIASSNGFLEGVEFLLDKLKNEPNRIMNEPFLIACERGKLAVVNALLKTNRVQIETLSKGLSVACQHDRTRVAMALLREKDVNINDVSISCRTPIWYAASHGNLGLVKCLLKMGANPGLKNSHLPTQADEKALDIAKKHGHTETINLLEACELVHNQVNTDAILKAFEIYAKGDWGSTILSALSMFHFSIGKHYVQAVRGALESVTDCPKEKRLQTFMQEMKNRNIDCKNPHGTTAKLLMLAELLTEQSYDALVPVNQEPKVTVMN